MNEVEILEWINDRVYYLLRVGGCVPSDYNAGQIAALRHVRAMLADLVARRARAGADARPLKKVG